MGFFVHLHVCFEAKENTPLAELAKKHLKDFDCREAKWFLEDMSKRSGNNPGPKGGIYLWGIGGNSTNVEEFVTVLEPFWVELMKEELMNGHILVFYEREQSGIANVYEIMLKGNEFIIKHHQNLPFCWNQY